MKERIIEVDPADPRFMPCQVEHYDVPNFWEIIQPLIMFMLWTFALPIAVLIGLSL